MFPAVDITSITPSDISRTDTSNVPPPRSNTNTFSALAYGLEKKKEEKVLVLSAFPFFLIEYFGEEFFSLVVSWVVWHKKLPKKTTQEKIKIFVIFYINRHFIVGLSVALNKTELNKN